MADQYFDRYQEREGEDLYSEYYESAEDATREEEDVAKEVKERVYETVEYETKQRSQTRIDRQFMEQQYSREDLLSRENTRRPAIQLHPIQNRVQELMHDYRKSDPGFRIGSATSETGSATAAAFNGLALRDQRESLSDAELEKFFMELVLYGWAWAKWTIVDDLDGYEGGDGHLFSDTSYPASANLDLGAFDKRLVVQACDNMNVYADPRDMTVDKRRMAYLIEVERMTVEERDRRYPLAAEKKLPLSVFSSESEQDQFWFGASRAGPMRDRELRIATYYKRVDEPVDFVWLPKFGSNARRADRLSAEDQAFVEQAGDAVSRFKQNVTVIEKIVTDGMFELAPRETLPWGRIPFFRGIGQEYMLDDGAILRRGLVFILRDLNKWMSITASDLAYKQALAGQDGWVASKEAIRGEEKSWRDTTKPVSARLWHEWTKLPGSPGGEPLKLTQPQYISTTPALEAGGGVMGLQRELVGMSTGSADAERRDTTNQFRSAAALDRMDEMAAMSRTSFMRNMEKITAKSMGEIWLRMARFVYDRPGRIVRIAPEQSHKPDRGWLIGQPFIHDLTTGEPVPIVFDMRTAQPVRLDRIDDPSFGVDLPDEITRIPNEANPQMYDEVMRFNPPTDVVKVTTNSSSLQRIKRESMIEWYMSLVQVTGPGTPVTNVLVEAAIEAAADVLPVGETLEKVRAAAPTPPADPANAAEAPAVVAAQNAQMQQMQQAIQELQKKADPAQAARDVAQLNAANNLEIAKLKSEVELLKTQMQVEQKREESIIDASVKSDIESDKVAAAREKTVIDAAQKSEDSQMAAATQASISQAGNKTKAMIEGMKTESAERTAAKAAEGKDDGGTADADE